MTHKKDIIERALDFDLNDNEIEEFESNINLERDLNDATKADVLAKEIFIPGYSNLIEAKRNELTKSLEAPTIHKSSTDTNKKARKSVIIKLLSIAAFLILAISIFSLFNAQSSDNKNSELKRLVINSFDNSGLLHNSRSSEIDELKESYYSSYQNQILITEDKCILNEELCQLTNATIYIKSENYKEAIKSLNKINGYIEIKNKLLLYSYLQLDDDRYLESLRIIKENKFPNHDALNRLLKYQ